MIKQLQYRFGTETGWLTEDMKLSPSLLHALAINPLGVHTHLYIYDQDKNLLAVLTCPPEPFDIEWVKRLRNMVIEKVGAVI